MSESKLMLASQFGDVFRYILLALFVGCTLFGCGGGGGSSGAPVVQTPPPTNPPPGSPPPSGAFGLSSRNTNSSCIAPTRTATPGNLSLVIAFPNVVDIPTPVKLIQPLSDSSIWYSVGLTGEIARFANSPTVSEFEIYLTVPVTTQGEGGLLSAVFHPNWPIVKELYVSYTIDSGGFESRLSRLVISNDATLPATYVEEILMRIDQPLSNHNGGDIAFGPDGYLYFSMGDGGPNVGTNNTGQQTNNLLGNILRIDVNGVAFPSPGYNIPPTNPFAGNSRCGPASNVDACPEIFAFGLRNPWRMSFDRSTGDLWVGDVGESLREEVNIVTVGGNYGWNCVEGTQETFVSGCPSPPSGFIAPVHEYPNNGLAAITGGFVYRGSQVPSLAGKYVFADSSNGAVTALTESGGNYTSTSIGNLSGVTGFAEDNNGELFLVRTYVPGVYKFSDSGSISNDNVPDQLSATGCVDATDPTLPASGLVPYEPQAQFWSDGAIKDRWVGLPDATTIGSTANGNWVYPPGTVIMKNFTLNSLVVETRLFMRHPDGAWAGYSYQWNDAQTLATRVRNRTTRSIGGLDYIYPGDADCLVCHTPASGYVLGMATNQLNSDFFYDQTSITDNQIEVFNHIGMFGVDLPEPVSQLPSLADPADTSAPLTDRARAYLHTNCAACHQPGGATGTNLDLRYSTAFADTQTCNVAPQAGDLGLVNPSLIAPGDPGLSILVARTNRRDNEAMPPLASNLVDTDGVQLLRDWVTSITACP